MFGKTLSENDMKHKANAVNSPHTQKTRQTLTEKFTLYTKRKRGFT